MSNENEINTAVKPSVESHARESEELYIGDVH